MRVLPSRPFAVFFFAASANLLCAQAVTVVDDTFSDGERATQNPPSSLAWYTTTAARSNLAARTNALTLVANNADRSIWSYFPAVTLGVGDSLTLTLVFTFSATPPNLGGPSLKIGLCHTNGVDPKRLDGGVPTGRYTGYASFTNQGDATGGTRLRKRNGPAAANPTSQLLEITDGPTDIAWNTFGAERSGLSGILRANTAYTATLKIIRTGADTASVSIGILGADLSTTNTLLEFDPSGIFATFDTLAITPAQTPQAGDMSIARALIVHDRSTARLGNLAILTSLAGASDNFTMGYVVSGASVANPKPLVIRAAGPSLGALGVPGTAEDPKFELFAGSTKTGENDDWGGSLQLAAALANVGAFAYTGPLSKDAAIATNATTRDNSVKVSATGAGAVIAEIYDASPSATFSATAPRLANVSVLKNLGTSLTAGFVIGGTGSKQILIRAIGPGLAAFGVGGTVADPQLRLFSGAVVIGTNDNWSGATTLSVAFTSVGAFNLDAASKDAALLATLAPGNYTVEVSGVGGTTGVALVEVYEVP